MKNLTKLLLIVLLNCSLTVFAGSLGFHSDYNEDSSVSSQECTPRLNTHQPVTQGAGSDYIVIDKYLVDNIEYNVLMLEMPNVNRLPEPPRAYYMEVSDGSLCSGEVVIPAKIHYANDKYNWGGSGTMKLDDDLKVIFIHTNAFKGNDKITKVTLPPTCFVIEESSFEDCTSLEEVEGFCCEDGVLRIDASINSNAFAKCSALKYFNRSFQNERFPADGVFIKGTIERGAFDSTALKSVWLDECHASFTGVGIERVYLFNSGLYKDAFKDCTSLNTVIIVDVGGSLDYEIFNGCENLQLVEYHAANIFHPEQLGGSVWLSGNIGEYGHAPEEINIYIYPVKYFDNDSYCHLTAPNVNIKYAKSYPDESDRAFKPFSISFKGATIERLNIEYPFATPTLMYSNIGTLILKDNEEIPEYAFTEGRIGTLIFGENLKSIEKGNLENATIGKIICRSTIPPMLEMEAISSDHPVYDIPVYVPMGCVEIYRNAVGWYNFKNILESENNSGIDDIAINNTDEPAEIYALDGRRIVPGREGLAPGTYVIRYTSGKTRKIALK